MTFTARIKRHSAVWNLWRQGSLTGGVVSGVVFRWTHGDNYVTGVLAQAQIEALRNHSSVMLEAVHVAPAALSEAEKAPDAVSQLAVEEHPSVSTPTKVESPPERPKTPLPSAYQPNKKHHNHGGRR